mmetsp:Transcript_24967/g.73833  ORF Transcript_24967/g.73833 Transcript_24967/m.73833 type:complete len:314 (-) Transcript_24967:259-1200(-)
MFTTASTVRHRIFSPYGALAAGSAGVALCAGAGVAGGAMGMAAAAEPNPEGALNPNEFRPFKLMMKEKLTRNVNRYRFELPDNKTSGLYTASCLVTKAMMKEKPEDEEPKAVVRPYTPTTTSDTRGYMDLIIKVYPDGKMGNHIDSLKVGDTLEMKGPIPKFPYKANMKQSIGMVAGGSGITPMLQVVDTVLSDPADKTDVSLVYANTTDSDIILKDKIDELAKKYPYRFKVYYVVDNPSWGGMMWKGGKGRVTGQMLKEHLPPPSLDNLVMVCGPPGMMNAVSGNKAPDKSQGELTGLLKELGYTKDNVFKF